MAVLALVFGGALLVAVIVIVVQAARHPGRVMHPTGTDTGPGMSWLPAVLSSDSGSSCSGADAGSGCDGGGGD